MMERWYRVRKVCLVVPLVLTLAGATWVVAGDIGGALDPNGGLQAQGPMIDPNGHAWQVATGVRIDDNGAPVQVAIGVRIDPDG